jgi:hypothetical protein
LVPANVEINQAEVLGGQGPRATVEGVAAGTAYTLSISRDVLLPFEGQKFNIAILAHA